MSPTAIGKYLAGLVLNLSEAFITFSHEAVKLNGLLERSEAGVSSDSCCELQKQCIAEVQAFERYLNRKEEIFAYLNVAPR
jgi:hypothetical protein